MEGKFNKEDKENFIHFVNFVYKHAEFNKLSAKDTVTFAKLINYMETKVLPKIDANMLEIIDVINNEDNKEE